MSGPDTSIVTAGGQRWDHYPGLNAAYSRAIENLGLLPADCGRTWCLEALGIGYAFDTASCQWVPADLEVIRSGGADLT